MIGFLRGKLLDKDIPHITLEVNGIGYEIQIPANGFSKLPQIGGEIGIYVHFVSREDGQFLYGFIDKKERSLFRALIKVNGVGPKMALAVLSFMEPRVFMRHLLNNDAAAIESIPGVGGKTAKRLIIELRDKVSEFENVDSVLGLNAGGAMMDAISALIALGYSQHEAHKILEKHKAKDLPSAELIRLALKEIK